MNTWNRLTAVRGQGGGAGELDKGVEGLAKEQTCMTHRHRQQCGHGQREVRRELGGSGQR